MPKETFKVFSEIEWLILAPSLAVKMLANEIDITAGQKTYPTAPGGRLATVFCP
jgi:hypothetical protein